MKKVVNTVCLPCGRENDNINKQCFGVWNDTCDMCGAENVPCADARHDFGIYIGYVPRREKSEIDVLFALKAVPLKENVKKSVDKELYRKVVCSICHGRGAHGFAGACYNCRGDGFIFEKV